MSVIELKPGSPFLGLFGHTYLTTARGIAGIQAKIGEGGAPEWKGSIVDQSWTQFFKSIKWWPVNLLGVYGWEGIAGYTTQLTHEDKTYPTGKLWKGIAIGHGQNQKPAGQGTDFTADTLEQFPASFQNCYATGLLLRNGAYDVVTTMKIGTLHYQPDDRLPLFTYYSMAKFSIYLPFLGYVNVEAEDVIDRYVDVYYSINIESGDATITLISKNTMAGLGTDSHIIYNTTVKLAIDIPLISNSYNMAGIMGTVTGLVALGATAGTAAPAVLATAGLAAGATLGDQLIRTDNRIISGGGNIMTMALPTSTHMIVTTPKMMTSSQDYEKLIETQGAPVYRLHTLSDFNTSGTYFKVGEIHFERRAQTLANSIQITDNEINEITTLLKNGVHSY